MKFAVETWDPAYGLSADESSLDAAGDPVDIDVEMPGDAWQPITPDPESAPPAMMFIDGVRRIDARIWLSPEGSPVAFPGVCATVAAGVVRSDDSGARVTEAHVERALYTAAPGAGPIVTKHGTYELRPTVDEIDGDSDKPLHLAIHNHMISLEQSLSVETNGAEIVIFDGPLRGRDAAAGVGYVKTQHVQYLPATQHAVVGQLAAGQRTPLFLIGGRFGRWSWYLRLPGRIVHPLSGIVRLELPGIGTASQAAERADLVSALLPRYASEPHKDSRAPQNLHPIAGLERELRRRLGDPYLLERALRIAS
jgi:hypothetical protein